MTVGSARPPIDAGRVIGLLCVAVVACLSIHYLAAGHARAVARVATEEGARRLTASDARHYLRIADAFAAGDWSFSHVAPTTGVDLAHRQPLYPFLLAGVRTIAGENAGALVLINLVFVAAALWVAFAIGSRVFGQPIAGAIGAWVIWKVPFLWDNATTRLLTEPGYIFFGLATALFFLRFASTGQRGALWGCIGAASLAYLQRVNGLFLLVAVACALGWVGWRRRRTDNRCATRSWSTWFAAVLIALTVTTPSWLPRLVYAGNPFYHGYLANYLWVDTYERAHVPGPPRFHARDYFASHDVRAIVDRSWYGLRRAFWEAPRAKYGHGLTWGLVAALAIVLVARPRGVLALLAVGGVQMLPLAWTALANPVRRIPATALLPFACVVLIVAVAAVLSRGTALSWTSRACNETGTNGE